MKKHCRLYFIVTCLLTLGLNLSQAQAAPVEFEAEGTVDYIGYSQGETSTITHHSRFKVSVRDCLWLIRVETDGFPFDYVEVGTDGFKVYTLVSLARFYDEVVRSGKRVPENIGGGEVVPGNIPRGIIDAPIIPYLWLAYASSCYFETNQTDRLCYLDDVTGYKNPYSLRAIVPATWTLSESHPHLPARVVAMQEGTVPYWDDPEYGPWVKPPMMGKYGPPYDHGYTNIIYQVKKHTTLGKISIPALAEVHRFGQKTGATSKDQLYLGLVIKMALTNLQATVSSSRLVPKIQGVTACRDLRFAFESPQFGNITYNFKGDWLSDQDFRERREFEMQSKNNQIVYPMVGNGVMLPSPAPNPRIKWLVILAFILSSLTLWVLVKNKKQK